MALKLMYITKDPKVAEIIENSGVDRVFVDLEYIGKDDRQGGMDTVQNHHTVDDIKKIRSVISKSQLVVRVNPIHNETCDYCSSEQEIDEAINAGADILMLPFFKTANDVQRFINAVNKRVKTMLLFETPESIKHIDEILGISGIDEVFIGLNDLSLGYGYKFMFKILADGTVEKIIDKFKAKNYHFGFGGVAALGKGLLPSEKIIAEHYRLGSQCVILSRSFCNTEITTDLNEIKNIFESGIKQIRDYESFCLCQKDDFFEENKAQVRKIVNGI